MTSNKGLWAFVTGISLIIAASITIACWDMNPWPTDAEVYYMPAAKELPSLKYLSQIHQSLDEERIKWLHGKELHVLAISLLQRAMGDAESLRPLLLLGVTSIFFSSILLFGVARCLWPSAAVMVWFLFAASFWPYLYVLFVKHQTQGLCFFLLSLFLILRGRHWLAFIGAGAAIAASIFSSTVSTLYLPYIAAALIYARKDLVRNIGLCGIGFAAVIVWANFPDIVGNLKSYWEYVRISGQYNHFYYNQKVLAQWLPFADLKDTRGGWGWIIRYFILVMPLLFAAYVAGVIYLVRRHNNARTWAIIALSVLPPVLAELRGVAQYGANYFPSLIGVLLVIGAALSLMMQEGWWERARRFVPAAAAVYFLWNAYVFATDIYPSRMSTTLISQAIERRGINDLYTYANHPLRRNIVDELNPGTRKHLRLTPIDSLIQVPSGYVLLPPVSTDTIYRGSNGAYNDFDDDLILNQIVRQGKLKDYAVASFKTLSSSLIWSQEEEILAYRYLVLGQFPPAEGGRAWLLDAGKIQHDRAQFLPTEEDLFLYRNHVRNIGTATRQMMYTGYEGAVGGPTLLKGLAARMFKMGDPKDNVRAFVFKVDDKQPTWLPYAAHFISKPVPAASIGNDPQGQAVMFTFDPPLQLQRGAYAAVIYRDGKSNDTDFYRIYADMLGRIEQ